MSNEMVKHAGAVPAIPGANEWALMQAQAETLAKSDIIPAAYRRKPENIVVAALTGRQYGWDVLTAMRSGHVIEGQWGMKPEAMLGLVRRAGHSVRAEISNDGATVHGTRADTGDEMSVTFTMEDAKRAKLTGKGTWAQWPANMCMWRATGMLCRMLFGDITAGVYTAEELGASVNEDGEVVDIYEPVEPEPLSDEQWEKVRAGCDKYNLDFDEMIRRAFPDGLPDPVTHEHLPVMKEAHRAMVVEQKEAEAADAEVIHDAEVVDPPDPHPVDEPGEDRPKASRSQVGAVKGQYERLGFKDDRGTQLWLTGQYLERPIDSHNDLNRQEASAVVDWLAGMPDDSLLREMVADDQTELMHEASTPDDG